MCMVKAAVCLRCIETCESCSNCLGCNPDRIVAAHRTELFIVAEATCRSSFGGYSRHVTSLKAALNVMQASRTTANAFGSAPCCWQKLSSQAQIRNIACRTWYPWSCCCQAKWLLGTVYVCVDTFQIMDQFSSCLSPSNLCSQSWTLYKVQCTCALDLLHLAVELSRHPTDHDAQAWGPGP